MGVGELAPCPQQSNNVYIVRIVAARHTESDIGRHLRHPDWHLGLLSEHRGKIGELGSAAGKHYLGYIVGIAR